VEPSVVEFSSFPDRMSVTPPEVVWRASRSICSQVRISQVRAPKARVALPSGVPLPSGKRAVSTARDRTRGGMLVDRMPSGSTQCHWQNQYRARQLASFIRSGELSSPFCGIVSR
jgi:hypothetical protein